MVGGHGMPDLTKSLSEGMDGGDEITRYLLGHTTGEQRDLAQEFVDGMARRAVLLRMGRAMQQPSAKQTAPATAPDKPAAKRMATAPESGT
jgi:hypothetical protein